MLSVLSEEVWLHFLVVISVNRIMICPQVKTKPIYHDYSAGHGLNHWIPKMARVSKIAIMGAKILTLPRPSLPSGLRHFHIAPAIIISNSIIFKIIRPGTLVIAKRSASRLTGSLNDSNYRTYWRKKTIRTKATDPNMMRTFLPRCRRTTRRIFLLTLVKLFK